jgi:hypothetical protein
MKLWTIQNEAVYESFKETGIIGAMIDKKIVQIKKSIENWEYRLLGSFGVDPCKCPKCGGKMRFNDIVYPRYGSMREYFKDKFISEGKEKLENILEMYVIAKGVLYGKIKPTTT